MKQTAVLLKTLGLLWAMASLVLAQDMRSTPALPSHILGPQLIVWSQLQKPQPVPQPLPDPPEQKKGKQVSPASPSASQQTSSLTLTGRIVKDGGRYVLRVAQDAPYQLDDQEKAGQYDNKEVRVHGTLDANNRHLRISSIELIS